MEFSPSSSPLFKPAQPTTDSEDFQLFKNLPEHLVQYQKIAKEARLKMAPIMLGVLGLTDKMALRGAAMMVGGHIAAANDEHYGKEDKLAA